MTPPDAGGRRVAFLTPEFPTKNTSGGVGNYVMKMATALVRSGATPEVFVPSSEPDTLEIHGFRVHHVERHRNLPLRAFSRGMEALLGPNGALAMHLLNARRLAAALERRHDEAPFDVVQSANYKFTGLFVRYRAERAQLLRLSTSRMLFDRAEGRRPGLLARSIERLDLRQIARADAAYAPSRFLADYFNDRYGTEVTVLRPPAELAVEPARDLPFDLPERFLVHFGTLGPRKGTEVVARALPEAWRRAPDLRMVWAGPIDPDDLARYRDLWGDAADRVVWLGSLDKEALYGVVARAVASVLPSLVDNLPNTVIESLALGLGVIGTDGASIDELVEEGRSGALVARGDASALAAAMAETWTGNAPWLGAGFATPEAIRAMRPGRAVAAFLDLATAAASAGGEPAAARPERSPSG